MPMFWMVLFYIEYKNDLKETLEKVTCNATSLKRRINNDIICLLPKIFEIITAACEQQIN